MIFSFIYSYFCTSFRIDATKSFSNSYDLYVKKSSFTNTMNNNYTELLCSSFSRFSELFIKDLLIFFKPPS